MNNQKFPISGHICWMLVIGMSIAYWCYTYNAQQKAYQQIQALFTATNRMMCRGDLDKNFQLKKLVAECDDLSRLPEVSALMKYETTIIRFLEPFSTKAPESYHFDTSTVNTWQRLYSGLLILSDSNLLPATLRTVVLSKNITDFHQIAKHGTQAQKTTLRNGLNFYLTSLWSHVLEQFNQRYQRLLFAPDTARIAIFPDQIAVVGQPFRANIFPDWYAYHYPDSLLKLSINGVQYPVKNGQVQLPMTYKQTGKQLLDMKCAIKDRLCGSIRTSGRQFFIQSMPQ